MSSFTANARGLYEAEEETDRESQNFEDFLMEQFKDLLESIVDEAKSILQNNMHVVTGELLSSIQVFENEGLYGSVGSDSDHAEYIEEGRGEVVPVTKNVLHWVDKETGEDVFSMRSGPTEPSPFFEPAVIHNTEQFPDIAVKRIAEEFD